MTQPFDSCRLFFAMRDKAWASGEPGVIDVDCDLDDSPALDMTGAGTRVAMDHLLEAQLVHRLTPRQEQRLGLEPRPGRSPRLFVEPMDDLMAATILMTRS